MNQLIKYRLESAEEKISAAEVLFNQGFYKDSISRSYYAMFSAVRALLATKKLDSAKHSGIVSLFNQHFIKTGIICKKYGRIFMNAKDYREKGDYSDYAIISKTEAEKQLSEGKELISEIKEFLKLN